MRDKFYELIPLKGSRPWLALSLLCFPTAVLALDMSALYLALPHIAASFHTSAVEELWILDIYPLILAGFLIPIGGMGDRFGNRSLLMRGGMVFMLISIIASMAPTALALIIARALLGIAGASLMPASLGIISDLFENPQHRKQAISIWTSAFMTGFAFGPIIGGVFVEFFGWRTIFLLAVPLMFPLLIVGPMVFPRSPQQQRQKKYDWISSILFLGSILPLVYGLKELARTETKLIPALSLSWGILCGVIFALRQFKIKNPLLDLRVILFTPKLGITLIILLLGPAIVGGVTFFVPQYLQLIYGLSAMDAGASIAPASFGLIIGALLSPFFSKRGHKSGAIIGAGFLVMSLGFMTIAIGIQLSPLWVIAGLFMVYLGCGPFDALGTDIVLSLAPRGKSASAGAAAETAVELGMGLGIALFGTLGTTVYQKILKTRLAENNITKAILDHHTDSFSVVMTKAHILGGGEGIYLQEQALEAFAWGVTTVTGIAVMLSLILSIISFSFPRKTP